MSTRNALWIAWPAFLAACLLQGLVFALVDPQDVRWLHGTLGWSRQAVYAAGFFAFWAIGLVACALTATLRLTPDELNEGASMAARRPARGAGQADLRDA